MPAKHGARKIIQNKPPRAIANKNRLKGTAGIVTALVFSVEFLIKTYLRNNFAFQSIPLIKNVFHITVIFNQGAAFGILKGKTQFLIYIGIIFILFLFGCLRKEKNQNLSLFISYGLILGGALSNLIDRIFLGHVVDYIDLRIWPVFNIADSCINIGVFLILINSFKKSCGKNIDCRK